MSRIDMDKKVDIIKNADGKSIVELYLYDILRTKKETSKPLEQ